MQTLTALRKLSPELARLVREANNYATKDTNATMIKLRILVEHIVVKMVKYLNYFELESLELESQIDELERKGVVPETVAEALQSIRIYGNRTVHEIYRSHTTAQKLLEQAHYICEWYISTFTHLGFSKRKASVEGIRAKVGNEDRLFALAQAFEKRRLRN